MCALQQGVLTLPLLDGSAVASLPVLATFGVGYASIVFEEHIGIKKAASALILGVLVWVFMACGQLPADFDASIRTTLSDVSEVVFFLLGALTIVELMNSYKCFDPITRFISAARSKELLVVVSVVTFLLSSVLNNLTVVVIMVSMVRKLVQDDELRRKLGGIIVIASNAGGAWTPIGDITTTMLYVGGQVTAVPLCGNLLLPSFLCLLGAVSYEYATMEDKEVQGPGAEAYQETRGGEEADGGLAAPPEGQVVVLWTGLLGMAAVPGFTASTGCPAWSGMLLVLGVLGVITSLLHGHDAEDEQYSVKAALARVDLSDNLLFFLGILLAVGALEQAGLLRALAAELRGLVPSDALVAMLLGLVSAILDNVPLVAAAQGMFDLTTHPPNDVFWNLMTICAATGGSLLAIGSAAGVALMGLEPGVTFGWYTTNVTPAALCGYVSGIAGVLVQQSLGLSLS